MKPIFRNAMFGFHKEDVFNFITKQNKQYDSRISELQKEKDSLAADVEELENLRARAREAKDFLQDIKKSISVILEDKEEIVACGGTCIAQVSEMKKCITSMNSRLQEAEALREKARKFDQLSNVLSSILVGKEDNSSLPAEASSSDVAVACYSELSTDGFEALADLLSNLSSHCEELVNLTETVSNDE